MPSIFATIVILILLSWNIYIHGSGCWGLQPGGRYSASLYSLQVLLALLTFLYAFLSLRKTSRSDDIKIRRILTICLFAFIGVPFIFGSMMFTSVHNQGLENLIPFLSTSLATIFAGSIILYSKTNKNAEQDAAPNL